MKLVYLGERTYNIDGQNYTRQVYINPYTDKVYNITTDIKQTGVFKIVEWDYSRKGLKIKQIELISNNM